MTLETARLLLRPISVNDAKALFEYRSDRATNTYQGWIPENLDEVQTFIGNTSKQINVPDTWFQFVILEKQTQKLIGDLGIHFFGAENKQVELGCTLGKDFHKNGYATEAVKRVIDYLFKELHKHRITTSIDPENRRSIQLVERIGFRKEAHFVESLYLHGAWVDDLVYALIEKDWERLHPG